jgi:hypothetical protein
VPRVPGRRERGRVIVARATKVSVLVLALIGVASTIPSAAGYLQSQRAFQPSAAGTLAIALFASDGIALGADRRATVGFSDGSGSVQIWFDDNPKLFSFPAPHNFVGVMTHGSAAVGTVALERSPIGALLFDEVRLHGAGSPAAVQLLAQYRSQLLTWDRFMPDFVATLPPNQLTVADYADRLKAFLDTKWQKYPNPADTQRPGFIVAGYDPDGSTRAIYHFNVGNTEPPVRIRTGTAIGGVSDVVALRLIDPGEGRGHTDSDIRQRFPKLSAVDLNKVIDRVHQEELKRPNYHPSSQSADATAGLIRDVISTTTGIQNSLSVQNAFLLGGRPNIATITPSHGFQQRVAP